MSREFTPEQQNAIDVKGADILVSAAAGSGKTAVLVERVIKTVTDEVRPVDIDRLLVVTFTEQAAAEMRRRVLKRLNELLAGDPYNNNIRKQLTLMPAANIMTIHAFCRKLVREHACVLGLDPRFKIGQQAELLVIKQELMETLLEEEYAAKDNTGFTNLVEMYADKYKDNSLRELIMETHEFMFASPWPYKRMEYYVGLYRFKDFDDTPFAAQIKDIVRQNLEGAYFELSRARDLCLLPDGPAKYIDTIDSDMSDVLNQIECCDKDFKAMWESVCAFEFNAKRLASIKKTEPVNEDLKETVKEIRQNAKDIIKKFKKDCFARSLEVCLEDLAKMEEVIKNIADITVKFAKIFQEEKLERNILDFNDLEQYALQVLYAADSNLTHHTLTEAAYGVRECFDEVLTDEYQDSNLIQEFILKAVSGIDSRNRFMVGDIKQSIYRFRQAMPKIFIEKYNTFKPYNDNKDAREVKINLSKNFRSRRNIIDTVNYLFCQLMSHTVGEIDYDDNAALYYGADYPPREGTDTPTEVCLIETNAPEAEEDETEETRELTKVQAEARFLARKIKGIVEDKKQYIYDAGTYKYARYGDIVILTPSVKAVGDAFALEFKKEGVPLYINADGEFFKTVEVQTILAILQITDNPKQDIHLITVLHSPIYGITCDELMEIRGISPNARFYDCLLSYDGTVKDKISLFLSQLRDFQDLAAVLPISGLIRKIYDQTHYFEYAGAMPGGKIRQANLLSLMEYAVLYEDTRLKGLFHFLKYIEKLRAGRNDLPEARITRQNEDIVRLITIHASKGLEFPIVFLSALHRGFGGRGGGNNVLFDTDYGIGADYIDLNLRIRYNTLPKLAIAHKQLKEEQSENLRVLYVALTRAKERLYLTGVVNDYAAKRKKWDFARMYPKVKLPEHYMLKAGNYLDFVMPAFLRKGGECKLPYDSCRFNINIIPAETLEGTDITDINPPPQEAKVTSDVTKHVRDTFNAQYEHKTSTGIPSKITISELKRINNARLTHANALPFYAIPPDISPPDFLSPKQGLSASAIGAAMHTVMEHIDLSREQSANDIKDTVAALTRSRLIDQEAAREIRINKIAAFFRSDLAKRIRKSRRVVREAPFVMAMRPGDIYADYKDLDETILLHGVIDLYFEEEGYLVLVDYKSDYVKGGQTEEITQKYAPQLYVYKKTLEESLSLPVKEVYLYLFAVDKAVPCYIGERLFSAP